MEVLLTTDQQELIRRAVQTGHIASEQAAISEALSLWEERERARIEFKASLGDALASVRNGGGREITPDSMRQLAEDVRRRGEARLLAELARAS